MWIARRIDDFCVRAHGRLWIWILAAVILLALQLQSISARRTIGPPSHEEVATTWVGLSEDELYLFRIVLTPDGNGSVGYVFAQNEPRVFRVSSWTYRAGLVSIEIASEDKDWDGLLEGEVNPVRMTLSMSGHDWSFPIFLRREAELETRWRSLKTRMADPN